jgi:mono/diheme cytochrome c family protein
VRIIGAAALAAMLCAPCASAFDDVANGNKLFTSSGSPCSQCHNLKNPVTAADFAIRGAANDPDLIDFAINTNPPSTGEMRPLYGAGAPFELSDSDLSDLAAYIASIVNPGGGGTPAFSASPASLDFGNVGVGAQSTPRTFTIKVSGAAGSIASVASSNNVEFLLAGGSCLATPASLAQDGSCTLQVIFAPGVVGVRSSTLSLVDDGAPNPLRISVSGTGADTSGGVGGSGGGTKVVVMEYYNASLGHYFITSNTGEIALLGKPPFEAWQPTGQSFNAYAPANAPGGTVGVCRFFNDHFLGVSTHFYAPHGLGCEATITSFPDWTLEDPQLFYAMLPDAAGNCPTGQIPVYRLFNNGMGGAPNHRFTTDPTIRAQMLTLGYTPEGYGIGVGWCAPQ